MPFSYEDQISVCKEQVINTETLTSDADQISRRSRKTTSSGIGHWHSTSANYLTTLCSTNYFSLISASFSK